MEKISSQEMYSKVIAKAWSDPRYKEELLKNPESTLQSEGFEIPKGVKVIVCENTDKELYFVIPKKMEGELTEEQLEAASGGILFVPVLGIAVAAIREWGNKVVSPWLK